MFFTADFLDVAQPPSFSGRLRKPEDAAEWAFGYTISLRANSLVCESVSTASEVEFFLSYECGIFHTSSMCILY